MKVYVVLKVSYYEGDAQVLSAYHNQDDAINFIKSNGGYSDDNKYFHTYDKDFFYIINDCEIL